jgi:hypothetical protein
MMKIHLVESTMSGGEEGGKYIWWNLLCRGGGKRKIHLVESTMSKWPYLADKCRALRNNYKLRPFLTKTPRCLGFLVFHILWVVLSSYIFQ